MNQIQLQSHDPTTLAANQPGAPSTFAPLGGDGLSFRDILDIVNPLHHIPIIGSLYRKLTGDTIDPAMRVAGGALFGGPIGAAVSAVAVAFDESRRDPVSEGGDEPHLLAQPSRASPEHANPAPLNSGKPAATAQTKPSAPAPTLGSNDERQTRRGGWLVASAYGDVLPNANSKLADLKQRVDLSV